MTRPKSTATNPMITLGKETFSKYPTNDGPFFLGPMSSIHIVGYYCNDKSASFATISVPSGSSSIIMLSDSLWLVLVQRDTSLLNLPMFSFTGEGVAFLDGIVRGLNPHFGQEKLRPQRPRKLDCECSSWPRARSQARSIMHTNMSCSVFIRNASIAPKKGWPFRKTPSVCLHGSNARNPWAMRIPRSGKVCEWRSRAPWWQIETCRH